MKKTYDEDDEFKEAWGGQIPCVLGRSIKKRKLLDKKIINYVKWKPSNMGQLRFGLEVMKWFARDNMPFTAATSDAFKDFMAYCAPKVKC